MVMVEGRFVDSNMGSFSSFTGNLLVVLFYFKRRLLNSHLIQIKYKKSSKEQKVTDPHICFKR